MKTDVFCEVTISMVRKTIKIFIYSTKNHGYGVRVWSEGGLPAEELVKIAEGWRSGCWMKPFRIRRMKRSR